MTRKNTTIRISSLFFLGFFLSWSLPAESFHSPPFENLSREALEQGVVLAPSSSPTQKNSALLHRLFFAELLYWEGRLHEARAQEESAQSLCEELIPEGRMALACALLRARKVESVISFFRQKQLQLIEKDLERAKSGAADPADRFYAEGRIFSELPPGYGRDFSRANLAWQSLRRLHPELSSTDFWIFHSLKLEGKVKRAEALLEEGLKQTGSNSRWRLWKKAAETKEIRPVTEGASFGWGIGLFISPQKGLGAVLGATDDRIFDADRSAELSIWGSVQKNYGATTRIVDASTFSDTPVTLSIDLEKAETDFYGLGIHSSLSNKILLNAFRYKGRLYATQFFLEHFFLRVGYRLGGMDGNSIRGMNAFHSGVTGELGFQSEDDQDNPQTGALVSLAGYFPTEGLGSSSTFEEWQGKARFTSAFSSRLTASVHAEALHTRKNVPFGALPRLRGEIDLPGIREGRFLEKNIGAAWGELKYEIWGPFAVGGFATTATAHENFSDLLKSSWKAGGGILIEGRNSRARRRHFRTEIGIFAGEVTVSGSIGFRL
jgi:hypothetical protein